VISGDHIETAAAGIRRSYRTQAPLVTYDYC